MATLHVLNLNFFELIAVAIAAAAANVLSCWILPFIILEDVLQLVNDIRFLLSQTLLPDILKKNVFKSFIGTPLKM